MDGAKMRKQIETYQANLTPEIIDECSERAKCFAESLKLSGRDCMKYALAVDEILLKTSDAVGEAAIEFKTGTRYFRPFMSVGITAAPFNVFESNEEDGSVLGNSILKNLGLSPEYSYVKGVNTYFFNIRKKRINPLFTLLISLALAVFCSMLGLLLPDSFRSRILDGFLTPIYDTFFNILGSIAGPMVFLSVAWGIYGIGDVMTLKKIGKKLLASYMGVVFLITLIFSIVCVPALSLKLSGAAEESQGITAIFTMILSIIPSNIFSPFIDGNTLQIIFLAAIVGIALLFLGQKTNSVAKAVEQINFMVQFLIEFICKLVPFFIFIAIIEMMWSDKAAQLMTVGEFFAVFISCIIAELVLIVSYTSIKNHVSPFILIKKGLPTLLIALTTASSAAAFGPNITACNNSYGIDKKFTAFGVPLGMVIMKPTSAINYLAISLYCCGAYNVNISLPWFITMVFTVAVLAIATPPVPGGAIAAYTVMFAQLGIPAEALAIAIVCDTLADFLATGADQFLIPLELLNQASRLGMVDRKTLCKH